MKPKRISACPFCNLKYPPTKCQCKKFNEFKRNITDTPYFLKKLDIKDEKGYCAASTFLYNKNDNGIDFIMIRENRNGIFKLNFPGGKREAVRTNGKLRIENSFETAYSEFIEELANETILIDILEDHDSNERHVYWNPKSKCVTYIIKANKKLKSFGKNTYVINSKTLNIDDLHTYVKHDVFEIIKYLENCKIFN